MAEWTPEMQAELEASIGPARQPELQNPRQAQQQQVPVGDEAATEPGEETPNDQETLQGMKRRLGERDHEIGDLRKQLVELKGAKDQKPEPTPEDTSARDKQRFNKVMSIADPRWEENAKDADYVAAMETQYRLHQLTLAVVNDALVELRGQQEAVKEQERLRESGYTPEIENQIATDPELSDLWQAASTAGRQRILKMLGAGGGQPPAVGGTRNQPRRIDASLAVERPGAGGAAFGLPANPELDREALMDMRKNPAEKKQLETMLDEMLDRDNAGTPGYKFNPGARGR